MLLTIGMATYDDHPGTWFTLTLLHHQLIQLGRRDDVQLLLVDNKPDSPTSATLRTLCQDLGAKYVPQASPVGTGPARERIFAEAVGEWVEVMDSHVWQPDYVRPRLFDFITNNSSPDFWQGVCRRSKLWQPGYQRRAIAWTHWDGRWGEFGRIVIKPGSGEPAFVDQAPFEIPYGGLGWFLCRRDAWLGFHPEFRGFGVEGYLQDKWRAAGRKCWCLPFADWVHCFQPPGRAIRPNHWVDRSWNYLLYHRDLQTIRLTDLRKHHVEKSGRTSLADWQKLLDAAGVDEAAVLEREAAEQAKNNPQPTKSELIRSRLAVDTDLQPFEQTFLDNSPCTHRQRRSGTILCNKGCPSMQSQPYALFDCRKHGAVTLNAVRSDLRSCVQCLAQEQNAKLNPDRAPEANR